VTTTKPTTTAYIVPRMAMNTPPTVLFTPSMKWGSQRRTTTRPPTLTATEPPMGMTKISHEGKWSSTHWLNEAASTPRL
jgi:hypothetical protein